LLLLQHTAMELHCTLEPVRATQVVPPFSVAGAQQKGAPEEQEIYAEVSAQTQKMIIARPTHALGNLWWLRWWWSSWRLWADDSWRRGDGRGCGERDQEEDLIELHDVCIALSFD
jgi:hypothetical protein